jgi:5-deoxy-glucuronate isomerase
MAVRQPVQITPQSAGWEHVGFTVVELDDGSSFTIEADATEHVVVVQAGNGTIRFDDETVTLSRSSVFREIGRVVYLPPGTSAVVTGAPAITVAVGSAPAADGPTRHPARVVEPREIRNEVRGGGQAYRQVLHSYAPPLPATRLIVYEVYVPRGTWSGWPPHCHDGLDGSPYLEETYYFRLDRPEGFAMHRNWRETGDPATEQFDETVVLHDGEVALVPRGYHSSVACPGANMYFLNILAGHLVDDARATPPCFAAEHTWIAEDWTAGTWSLPVVAPPVEGR